MEKIKRNRVRVKKQEKRVKKQLQMREIPEGECVAVKTRPQFGL